MKMKGQLDVKTPAEYIAAVDDKRRPAVAALDALIRTHAPQLEPAILAGTLRHAPGTPAAIAWSCAAADAKGYVAERHVDRLPKANIGKTCVMIKKLADRDEKAL